MFLNLKQPSSLSVEVTGIYHHILLFKIYTNLEGFPSLGQSIATLITDPAHLIAICGPDSSNFFQTRDEFVYLPGTLLQSAPFLLFVCWPLLMPGHENELISECRIVTHILLFSFMHLQSCVHFYIVGFLGSASRDGAMSCICAKRQIVGNN